MWKNININTSNIKSESEKSYLISMPNNSQYHGYCFWHPYKLIKNGKNSASIALLYNNNFKFRLIKYGKGKWNKYDIIEEKIIDVEDFEEAFEVMNKNIKAPKYKSDFETHKPQILEPEDVEIIEELKDE